MRVVLWPTCVIYSAWGGFPVLGWSCERMLLANSPIRMRVRLFYTAHHRSGEPLLAMCLWVVQTPMAYYMDVSSYMCHRHGFVAHSLILVHKSLKFMYPVCALFCGHTCKALSFHSIQDWA